MKIIDLIILEQRFRIKLRATTRAQVDIVKQIADILNANVEMYASSVVDGVRQFTDRRGAVHTGNAAYITGTNTIVIDINAGDTLNGLVLNSLSHEVVHYIKEMSPDKFRKLADFVVGKFGEKGVFATKLIRAKQSKYAAQGQELSFMDAYEEVVADSVESMLSQKTEKIVSDIAEMRKVDADLAKTFVDKVKDLVGKMLNVFRKNKFQSNPETEEGKFFAKWSEFGDELSGIFAEAAADAADKAAQAARRTDVQTKENTPAEARMKNSIRSTTDGIKYVKLDGNIFMRPDGTEMTKREAYNALVGKTITLEDGDKITFIKNLPGGRSVYNELFNKRLGYDPGIDVVAVSDKINRNIVETLKASTMKTPNEMQRHPHVGVVDFDLREVYLADDNKAYRLELNIANLTDGTKIAYVKRYIENASTEVNKKIRMAETARQSPLNRPSDETSKNDVSISSIRQGGQKSQEETEKNSRRNLNERQIIVDMLKSLPYEVEHGGIGIIMAQIIRT